MAYILLFLADHHAVSHNASVRSVGILASLDTIAGLPQQVLYEFRVAAARPAESNGLGWSVPRTESVVAEMYPPVCGPSGGLRKRRTLPPHPPHGVMV